MRTLARAADKAEIVRRLHALAPDSARRWGRMTAHQMVCHLADAFRMCLGDKACAHTPGLFERTVVKWVALYAPLRWPKGITTTPEIDQQKSGTPPGAFADDLGAVLALVETVTDARALAHVAHPIFGRMSDADWLRWGFLHTDHHLRQFGA